MLRHAVTGRRSTHNGAKTRAGPVPTDFRFQAGAKYVGFFSRTKIKSAQGAEVKPRNHFLRLKILDSLQEPNSASFRKVKLLSRPAEGSGWPHFQRRRYRQIWLKVWHFCQGGRWPKVRPTETRSSFAGQAGGTGLAKKSVC